MRKTVLLVLVLWLLSTALSLCALGLLRLQIGYASPYTSINVDTAYNMITNGSYPDLVVLDVRTKSEYDGGHIYGAVWIPHTELEARIGELAGHENHEIIVYCLAGGRSATASGILDAYSFTKVYNMLGGISAWQTAGYPVWNATVHNLNTTFNYDTIQAAIDAPQTLNGHTILVDAGTYYEQVTISKSISLIGEDRSTTVIDCNGTSNSIVIHITANHVNVIGFTIRNGTTGIFINKSDYNIINGNIVTDNQKGIYLFSICTCDSTRENTIRNNIIKNNGFGISLGVAIDNDIYHNNFINNTQQVHIETSGYANLWDDSYPSGGNYWSDYEETYPDAEEIDESGIWDTPYVIDVNNRDRYPLMNPLDMIPPITTSDYDGLWHTTDFTIILTATDDISGVAETYYKINDDPTKNVSAHGQPYTTSEGSNNKLEYWSVDVANNEESHHILTSIKLDKTQPTTTDSYDGLWHNTDFTITLTASDSLSGLAETCYKINDGSTEVVNIDGQPFISTEGANNTLEYWSVDVASNEEIHHFLTEIKLDKASPTIGAPSRVPDVDVPPGQSVKVSVNVTDALSGVKNVTLSYTVNDVWTDLPMNYNVLTFLYEATIPGQLAGTWVKYKIVTYDNAINPATKDGTEPYCKYQVIPEFPTWTSMLLTLIVLTVATAIYKRRLLKTSIH